MAKVKLSVGLREMMWHDLKQAIHGQKHPSVAFSHITEKRGGTNCSTSMCKTPVIANASWYLLAPNVAQAVITFSLMAKLVRLDVFLQ